MKYSLVNGVRTDARPKLSGHCQTCERPTIARCGEIKVWHWAHKGKRLCDPWWENETEWHRAWKDKFPVDCQEIVHHDDSGEKHIADVKTPQEWVIEFQHSHIKPEERRARNAFYKKLVWVVNGTRRLRDKAQFFEALNELNPVHANPLIRKVYLEGCAILRDWAGSPGPIFFDFAEEEVLWCLLPVSQDMWGYIVAFSRNGFIQLHNASKDQATKSFADCMAELNTFLTQRTLLETKTRELNALRVSAPRFVVRPRRHFRF